MPLKLNPIQVQAEALARDDRYQTILFRGGTGSGKTVFCCKTVIENCLRFAGLRVLICRQTAVEARDLIFNATFRDIMELMLSVSDGSSTWEYFDSEKMISRDPLQVTFPNGSSVRFGGLDDNVSLGKLLGADLGMAFLSECQNIDSYQVVQRVQGRLRQKLTDQNGIALVPKLILDCNPPSKRHWTYTVFKLKRHPLTGNPLKGSDAYTEIKMNAEHNLSNLAKGYLERMDYDERETTQMVKGEWYEEVDNPLFSGNDIAACRLPPRSGYQDCDDLARVVVAVDPAVSAKAGSDETGIIVVGIDDEDHGYVLEDLSGVYTPFQWADVAIKAFDQWGANSIIAEKNQGGDMVESNLRTVNRSVPVELIHASRGKEIRAEYTSTAYRQRRIHHCGEFPELESQLLSFETGFDRKRKGSPDRLDALVHGFNGTLFKDRKRSTGRSEINPNFWR